MKRSKFYAVVTIFEMYNKRVSPFFDTSAEVREWCDANGVQSDCTMESMNWQEIE